ncbi:MAG: prepilin peptidase [Spirochaetales bacterium]|nr:prepilin peptidase [Spirochaetales bacterium]
MTGFLLPIVIHDIRKKRIPDIYTFPGCASLFLLQVLFFHNYLIFIDAAAGYGFIWLVWFFTGGKIGRGDAKLSALIATGLGLVGWVIALFWASFTGLITGVILIKMKKLKIKEEIPFAPFLAAGGVISFITKDLVMRLYYVFQ